MGTLLVQHGISFHPFSEDVNACLPELPWKITDEERRRRTDLTHLDVCSIDPPGCADIDDALHFREIEEDKSLIEIGVHIADVTHFVKPGTAMDLEAADRGNTTYLTDRRIDMLPKVNSRNERKYSRRKIHERKRVNF